MVLTVGRKNTSDALFAVSPVLKYETGLSFERLKY